MKSETGRSMIEMLGVLSIVGILSVGGISAFSKTMMKYKSIKFSQTTTLFIHDLLSYKKELLKLPRGYQTPILAKMPFIPNQWTLKGNNIYDIFGSAHRLYIGNQHLIYEYVVIARKDKKTKEKMLYCQTFISDIVKPHSPEIYTTILYSENKNARSWYGDNYCQKNCIRDITPNDIYNFCQATTESDANTNYIAIYFP